MRRLGKPIEPTRCYGAEAGEGAPVKSRRRPARSRDHGQAVVPFFCLERAASIPYTFTWDPETVEFRGVEGPRFTTYREAVEASRFLMPATGLLDSYMPPRAGML